MSLRNTRGRRVGQRTVTRVRAWTRRQADATSAVTGRSRIGALAAGTGGSGPAPADPALGSGSTTSAAAPVTHASPARDNMPLVRGCWAPEVPPRAFQPRPRQAHSPHI